MQPSVKAELLLTQYRGRYLCNLSIGRGYPKQMRVLINCVIVCVWEGWVGGVKVPKILETSFQYHASRH